MVMVRLESGAGWRVKLNADVGIASGSEVRVSVMIRHKMRVSIRVRFR